MESMVDEGRVWMEERTEVINGMTQQIRRR